MADNDKRVEPTPGPYTIRQQKGLRLFIVANDEAIAEVFGDFNSAVFANADVLRASWEMGQLLLRAYGHWEMTDDTRAEVEAVLKKAGLLK